MKKGWTVLFYICSEDQETRKYSDALIDLLLKTRPAEHLRLLSFVSTFENDSADYLMGKLYKLEYDPDKQTRVLITVKDYQRVDPGNKSVFKKVLQTVVEKDLMMERFLLFPWDHGAGFGIFGGDPRMPGIDNLWGMADSNPDLENIDNAGAVVELKVITNRFSAASRKLFLTGFVKDQVDLIAGNQLAAEAMQKKIEVRMLTCIDMNEVLNDLKIKVDLMIMLNCWMQMLENGYEFSKSVRLIVAAETVNFFAGYDYEGILSLIVDDAAAEPERIAAYAVDSLPNLYEKNPVWTERLNELVVSAVRPAAIDDVIAALSNICEDLRESIKQNGTILRDIRTSAVDLTFNYFIDENGNIDNSQLDCYIDLVAYLSMAKEKNLVSNEKLNALIYANRAFIINKCPAGMQDPGKASRDDKYGYSVYHPCTTDDFDSVYCEYFYTSKRSRLSRTPWGSFLSEFKNIKPAQ